MYFGQYQDACKCYEKILQTGISKTVANNLKQFKRLNLKLSKNAMLKKH